MSKAAEKLLCSLSSISTKISSLEKDLGYLLFERKIKHLYITKQGKEFYKTAKEILEKINNVFGEINRKNQK